ncbi:hypothetical protein, partial [Endothiovibrio diazotrophicus]
NIVSVVDVLGALSRRSLDDHLFMMDNGRDSLRQGGDRLVTVCHPGTRLNWVVYAMDVQTPVVIREIRFIGRGMQLDPVGEPNDAEVADGTADGGYYWSGVVPADLAEGVYRYRLTLQMGRGERSTLSSERASLRVGKRLPNEGRQP